MKLSLNQQHILVAALKTVAPLQEGGPIGDLLRIVSSYYGIDPQSEEMLNRLSGMVDNVVEKYTDHHEPPKTMSYYAMHTELHGPAELVTVVLSYVSEGHLNVPMDMDRCHKHNAEWVAQDMLALHGAQVEETW